MISISVLILLGLPPQIAIATNKFGGLGASTGAFRHYSKSKKINWRLSIIFSFIAVIASFFGAVLMIKTPNSILKNIIAAALLLLMGFTIFSRETGIKKKSSTPIKRVLGFILYFLLNIFAGGLGVGTGVLILLTLSYFFGMTFIESKAADNLPWILSGLTVFIVYAYNGLIDYFIGVVLMAGMFAGATIGAKMALLKGNKWVRTILIFVAIAAAIKLLLF